MGKKREYFPLRQSAPKRFRTMKSAKRLGPTKLMYALLVEAQRKNSVVKNQRLLDKLINFGVVVDKYYFNKAIKFLVENEFIEVNDDLIFIDEIFGKKMSLAEFGKEKLKKQFNADYRQPPFIRLNNSEEFLALIGKLPLSQIDLMGLILSKMGGWDNSGVFEMSPKLIAKALGGKTTVKSIGNKMRGLVKHGFIFEINPGEDKRNKRYKVKAVFATKGYSDDYEKPSKTPILKLLKCDRYDGEVTEEEKEHLDEMYWDEQQFN